MKNIVALLCGTLFGLGLAVSGMTDTNKVRGFLDVFGNWVPDLIFVMAAAVVVTALGYKLVLKADRPLLDADFHIPSVKNIDWRLVTGSAIFGIGWGLFGYCPGPAVAALAYLDGQVLLFLACMFVGMWVSSKVPAG